MVGPTYDFILNPLGAVRLSFDKAAAAAAPSDGVPSVAMNGKDWRAVDLFNNFLFEQNGLSKVPILNQSNLRWIKPNTLVRFRGMIQDMFGNELYVGAFKDGSTWRTNKFTDFASFPMPSTCETRLWERRLFHCVPVPGQNSWTLESAANQNIRDIYNDSTSQHGEKRQRDDDVDRMDLNALGHEGDSASFSKKQKEDECSSHLSNQLMIQDNMPVPSGDSQNLDPSSFSCLVKVYDMPESHLKLNDVFEFIGIYTFDPELAVHKDNDDDDSMYDLMEDDVLAHLPPSKVPRLHCLICRKLVVQDFLSISHLTEPLPNIVRGIRESFIEHLTGVLGNDGLAAQFILLHLLSKLRARSDWLAVGKLSLNLISFTKESASIFGNRLVTTIQSVLPFSQAIPLTVQYLNTATLQPRKNNQTGRLVTGTLQLAQGTHLTIDETHLQAGELNSTGVENARLLKHLMEWQKVEYDFEFYKLEMTADVQMLILSEGKSNILPADLVVPFRPSSISSEVISSDEKLQAWRWYLATLRSLPYSNGTEMLQTVQDEMVAAMKEDRTVGATNLNRWLTMAQLISASFGETSLSLERWQMAKELERLRKERII